MITSPSRMVLKSARVIVVTGFAMLAVAIVGRAWAAEVQRVVSPGGIEAWLVEEPSIPIIAMRFAFRGGAKLDPPGKSGMAEFVSGLLDEGAGDLDSLAFQTLVDKLAMRLRFNAERDEFLGTITSLRENYKQTFELLALALTEPRFDAIAVERIRQQSLARLAQMLKDPGQISRRMWARTSFPDHPYGWPVEGTPESVQAITVADLHEFVRQRFAKDALVVGVAGNISAEELAEALDMIFGGLPARSGPAITNETQPAAPGSLVVERVPVPQSVVVFGHKGLPRSHPDYYTAYVVNHILGGGGFSSRLTNEVREKRGLAYSIYSYMLPMQETALWVGGTATANGRVADTLAVIRGEVARMRDAGVTEAELADAKTFLTGSFPLRFDSNAEVAGMLVGMQLHDLGIDYIERRNGLIEGVTLADAQRVANSLFRPEELAVVVVGDPEGIEPSPPTD